MDSINMLSGFTPDHISAVQKYSTISAAVKNYLHLYINGKCKYFSTKKNCFRNETKQASNVSNKPVSSAAYTNSF